jgi:phosphate:Na+ symporter
MKEVLIFATGLVLFLFGMTKLSAGVQQLFTSRIREYIKYSVKKPVYGLLTGIATTILFQSSSATTLLTVGMVSAGLMTFYHSLGIILGADIGTVLTVQLVVWRFTDISPLIVVSGGIVWLTGKGRWKAVGEAVFYFGLLFFGLSLAAMTTAPLKDNQAVISFFQEPKNPFLGFGIGIVFTGIVHASVIPISILAILAQHDLITIENALPVVFGANVGTTVTALMASAVGTISGKRSAVSHLLFKCSGAFACMVALPWLTVALKSISSNVAQQIVLGHLLFNLLIVAFFIFFLKPFARLIERIIPGEEDILPLWPEFLNDRCLVSPKEALLCVRKELQREIILVQRIFVESSLLVKDYKEWKRQNIIYVEFVVDVLRREIVNFLRKISCMQLSPEFSQKLFTYTAMADDIERIGDHAVLLAKLASNKYQAEVSFTEMGKKELGEIEQRATENLRDAVSLIGERNEEKIKSIFLREEDIDVKVKEARERHLVRYYKGICQAEAGPIFIEMLIHLERISDLCQNVAEYVDELKDF